jgi:hypothetical protein
MNQDERTGQAASPAIVGDVVSRAPSLAGKRDALLPQGSGASCGCNGGTEPMTAGSGTNPFVYAIGQIEVRFPNLSLEKEFAQAMGRAETAGLSDRQVLQSILSERRNRYLARQLCWVLRIEGIDTYIIVPRDPTEFDSLIESVRPTPTPGVDADVVVGVRGPIAPAEMCNGLMVPVVAFDQIYSFDSGELLKSIPRPEGVSEAEFLPRAQDVYQRLIQVADNAGATDEHRALNYLATRYSAIYARASDAFASDFELAAVDVQPSRLSGARRIVTVTFTYNQRGGATAGFFSEQYFVRVDVTEEFPFLVTPLQRGFMR